MTRDQIKERVAGNLYDASMINFDSEALNDSIQDGYDEVSLLTQCIENITTINYVANLTYYNFGTLISDYFRVIAIWNNNNNRWLEPISYGELDDVHPRWETQNGEPNYFCMLGWEYISLYKKLATATGSMLVFYKARANTLVGATTPTIPGGSADILENYSTQDQLDSHLEYTKALQYWTRYQEQVRAVIKDVNRRSQPDRLLYLAEVVGKV